MSDVMTAPEVAEHAGVTEIELWRLVEDGLIPAPDVYTRNDDAMWTRETAMAGPPIRAGKRNRADHQKQLLDEVRHWVWRNGNARIPQSAVGRMQPDGTPFRLGSRVSTLRAAYANNRLTRAEAAAFEALPGWTWDMRDAEWRDRFNGCVARFPHLTASDKSWLRLQNSRRHLLRPEWRELLDQHPGFFASRRKDAAVSRFISAVSVWIMSDPTGKRTAADLAYNTEVTIAGRTVLIGRQAVYFRRRYFRIEGASAHRLPASDAARIEQLPGWTWDRDEAAVKYGEPVAVSRARHGLARAITLWIEAHPDQSLDDMKFDETIEIDGRPYCVGRRLRHYRARYHAGSLPQAVIDALNEVDGWTWGDPRRYDDRPTADSAKKELVGAH